MPHFLLRFAFGMPRAIKHLQSVRLSLSIPPIATSLSTDAFLNALRRLIAIRGPIRSIHCDKGTNFVGADNEIKNAVKEMDGLKIADYLKQKRCDYVHFEFHVPHASHFGGAWERHIRSARRILSSLLRSQGSQLTDETLRTLMFEVAALVNSRPLTVLSSSNDLQMSLSPQNLLTAKSDIIMPPPGNFEESDVYSKKYWRRIQYLCNVFWRKWQREYLLDMQNRQKWNRPHKNLKVGDVVLLKDELLPRGQWSLCIIDRVYTSSDGKVRSVRLKVGDKGLNKEGKRVKATSYLDRPIHKLILIVPKQS